MIGNLRDGFLPGRRQRVSPTGDGLLVGRGFAVKDVIDVAGYRTGAGNPDWLAHAVPTDAHAPVVERLLGNGASCLGKTVTDEFAISLEGENVHYGTPNNPRDADALPGGSSSGSAVAVASGEADFALGTDTGGSVRVPAAFCGVFGFRPSHGRMTDAGVMPLAPSYDTVGWFAREADILEDVGRILLPEGDTTPITRIALAEDVLTLVAGDVAEDMIRAAARIATERPMRLLGGWSLDEIHRIYVVVQGYEIGQAFESGLAALGPRMGPAIADRFASAFAIDEDAFRDAAAARRRFETHMHACCPPGLAILLPTVSVRSLSRRASASDRVEFYSRTLGLTAIAGHAGMPQVQLGATDRHGPVGPSLIAARGSDRELLALAKRLSTKARHGG